VTSIDPPFRFPEQYELFQLWMRKRGSRRMPVRAELDAAELRPWLGHLHLIEVVDQGRDFKYLVYGTEIARYYDIEMTGRLASSWPETMRNAAFQTYTRIVRDRCPYVVAQNEWALERLFSNHRIVLPFSRDGREVDHILTYVRMLATPDGKPGVQYHPIPVDPAPG
jgi:hypothetical protein